MANKQELLAQAKDLGITTTGEETNAVLENMINSHTPAPQSTPPAPSEPSDPTPPIPKTQAPAPVQSSPKESMIPLSQVKQLIAEAIAAQPDPNKPAKAKRVTEHHAHVWRFDGKWVVDFKDRNQDPYVKEKIHAFQKFNEQKREFEAWIEIVMMDEITEELSYKELPLNRYVERRVLVYCPITERKKADRSYSIGEVEKKKDVGGILKGTGVMVDQEVEMYQETFVVKTPTGKVLTLPDYVIC